MGTCEMDANVKSFSGYIDVEDDGHIFWFFEAHNGKPPDAPLTVWINGGPDSSSMIGLFQELGPCSVDSNGTVINNPYAWNNASNMIFINQPATTGFSYTKLVPGYVDPNSGSLVMLPDKTCPEYAQGYGMCGTYLAPNVTLTDGQHDRVGGQELLLYTTRLHGSVPAILAGGLPLCHRVIRRPLRTRVQQVHSRAECACSR